MYREYIDLVPWILLPMIFTLISSSKDSVSAKNKNTILFFEREIQFIRQNS